MEHIYKVFNTMLQNTTTKLLTGLIAEVDLDLLIDTTMRKVDSATRNNSPIFAEGMKCYALALTLVRFNTGKVTFTFEEFTQLIQQIQDHRDYIIPSRQIHHAK